MKQDNVSISVAEGIRGLLRSAACLAAEIEIAVREEPHCPDAGCPLRRTVVSWNDNAGAARRLVIVKPADYVRRADIQRALRQPRALAGKT